MAPWERYARDLQGAWHAIDDLRDQVEANTILLRFVLAFASVISGCLIALVAHFYG